MVTRHSKQIPMPQRGPRGSPETDRRNVRSPAIMIAAATVVPLGTSTGLPLTESRTGSGMNGVDPLRQIWVSGDFRIPAQNHIRQ